MVISKYVCIPLLIFVPLIILIFESREKDFVTPPSDQEVAKKVAEWKATKPALRDTTIPTKATEKGTHKPTQKPTTNPIAEATNTKKDSQIKAKIDATRGLDLEISPGLNHFQGMKTKRLKALAQQLDPETHPQLIYLAHERILDSAADASPDDIHASGEYISKHQLSLWNPEPSLRTPLKITIEVQSSLIEKATQLIPKIESIIFFGSGGTVKPSVTIKEATSDKNTISLTGKQAHTTAPTVFQSHKNSEEMLASAIQLAVTQAIRSKKIPILHTDKIHYSYFTRLTWITLANSL